VRTRGGREAAEHRLEIEVPVRDVERDEAPRCELVVIELECLARHEMRRDGVRAERIEHQQIEPAVRRLHQ